MKILTTALATLMAFVTLISPALAEEKSLSERMLHHRAIDAAVWAMPLTNFKAYRTQMTLQYQERLKETQNQ